MVIGHSGIRIIMTERELGMKERADKCQQLGSRDHELRWKKVLGIFSKSNFDCKINFMPSV